MFKYIPSLCLVAAFSLLFGCAYNNCGSDNCVATTSYVPTTTYVKKTVYVPSTTYTSTSSCCSVNCCPTCTRCGYDYGYSSYNVGWY